MLISLEIKNIAVIKDITINFKPGFNVITGETGTGKSIVIDALNFALGERADKTLIRHGEEFSTVQAVFFISNNKNQIEYKLKSMDIDFNDGNIIITRSMFASGRTECRINNTLVTLSVLKEISSTLIDIHSQHETSELFDEKNHLFYIDQFSSKIDLLKNNYLSIYSKYQKVLKELASLPPLNELNREIELVKFQIDEIEGANLELEEESNLIKKRKIIQNREKLLNSLNAIENYFSNDVIGIEPNLKKCLKEFIYLQNFEEIYQEFTDRVESLLIESKDIYSYVQATLSNNLYDDIEAERINSRIDLIRKLKLKYGDTEEKVLSFLDNAKLRYEKLLNSDHIIEQLSKERENLTSELIESSNELHLRRLETADLFSVAVLQQLNDLGLKEAKFKVYIKKDEKFIESNYKFTEKGIDSACFYLSPNPGEPLKELKKVASGGELSRIMLGIKNITATVDDIFTIVFDEIDSGISGNAAQTVSKKLYDISQGRQIIVITHLAQIAAMADANFLIIKNIYENETITEINPLDEAGTLNEIIRIGGLTETSQFGLGAAKELLDSAKRHKEKT